MVEVDTKPGASGRPPHLEDETLGLPGTLWLQFTERHPPLTQQCFSTGEFSREKAPLKPGGVEGKAIDPSRRVWLAPSATLRHGCGCKTFILGRALGKNQWRSGQWVKDGGKNAGHTN
jgi:hypothetical protein